MIPMTMIMRRRKSWRTITNPLPTATPPPPPPAAAAATDVNTLIEHRSLALVMKLVVQHNCKISDVTTTKCAITPTPLVSLGVLPKDPLHKLIYSEALSPITTSPEP